ncbi:hypothetical protein [Nonomuraea insulae]|uniref:Uncharacterized protein n=1 Tax=Nonomuraea insulae TaxID=1616787 RepID=A0ABW1CC67_9ACTN
MTLTLPRRHRATAVPVTADGVGPALSCPGATEVITAAPRQVLPGRTHKLALRSGGEGSRDPFAASTVAALLALAPALPHPPGTVRHVPDLVGSVLLASPTAAGVLANSRGSAWGRLSSRALGCAGTFAALLTGSLVISSRRRANGPPSAQVAVPPAAALLAATALVRVAGASRRETVRRSQRAAEEGPARRRRLLAGPRIDQVLSPIREVNPR